MQRFLEEIREGNFEELAASFETSCQSLHVSLQVSVAGC